MPSTNDRIKSTNAKWTPGNSVAKTVIECLIKAIYQSPLLLSVSPLVDTGPWSLLPLAPHPPPGPPDVDLVNNVSRKWNSNGKGNHCSSSSSISLGISLLANLVTRTTHQASSSIGRQSSIHIFRKFPISSKSARQARWSAAATQSSDLIQMWCCWRGCLKRPSTSSSALLTHL